MTPVTKMEFSEAEIYEENRARPKVGRQPVKLRPATEGEQDQASWAQTHNEARKGDTQFMLLLVTLFVIVNLTLVTLLNNKTKPVAPAQPAASVTAPVVAAPVVTAPGAAQQPVATLPLTLPAPPPPAAVFSKPPAAPSNAYVTPVNPTTTRDIAAPFHPVTTTEQPVTRSGTAQNNLTVVHTPAPAAAAPALAPAAGTPEPNATQDLLNTINKD